PLRHRPSGCRARGAGAGRGCARNHGRPGRGGRGRVDRGARGSRSLMAGRRAGRRTALFLLYQWDVTGQPLTSLYEGEVDEFARGLAEAVCARAPELDAAITAAAEGWTADRLRAVGRNVLRIGTAERA